MNSYKWCYVLSDKCTLYKVNCYVLSDKCTLYKVNETINDIGLVWNLDVFAIVCIWEFAALIWINLDFKKATSCLVKTTHGR